MRQVVVMALIGLAGFLPSTSTQAQAGPAHFGSWQVATASDRTYSYAATMNDSGEMFGEFCYYKSGSCIWVIGVHTGCKKGDRYPVMANAASGATSLQILCGGAIGNLAYALEFSNWKALEASITDSSRVGFAIPLKDGQFIVVRFSLEGRTEATSLLEKSFAVAMQKRQKTSTSDQVL